MSFPHRPRPYNPRRHIQPIPYYSPPAARPTTNALSRPHAMHPNVQKLRIDPPVLLLLILCIVGLVLWLSYGIYMSVMWYMGRLRTVRNGLEENMNPEALMAKFDQGSYSNQEKEGEKFGQRVQWFNPPPRDDKSEHAWIEKMDLSRHQSVSTGSTLAAWDDNCKRSSLTCRRSSAD